MSAASLDLQQLSLACRDCSLHALCLPRGLNAQELAALERRVDVDEQVDTGQVYFEPDTPLSHLYAVRSGCFKSFRYAANGDEQVIGFHFPGELFGLDAIYEERHQCFSAPVVESSVCRIRYADLQRIADAVPALRRQLMRLMSRELGTRATFAKDQQADQAIAAFLMDVAQRVAERGGDAQRLQLPMPRRDIANYLRLRTETISRVLRRFQDKGWIRVDRRTLVLDQPRALEALLV